MQQVDWKRIDAEQPPNYKRVLFYIKTQDGKFEQHVGYRNNNFMVIGNVFSWDLGTPLYWTYLPPDPEDINR